MFHENKSSSKGEGVLNEPQPLISQKSMLTDQGCCKRIHLGKRLKSWSVRPVSCDQAPSARCSQSRLQLSPSRLTSSSLTRGGSILILSPGCSRVSEKILSPCHPHSQFPGPTRFSPVSGCSPLSSLLLGLLPGPRASAPACVSGLCYNYSLLCSHPHRLSKIPRFRRSCKSVSQSHGASH